MNLQIDIKGRNAVFVQCDSYEERDFSEGLHVERYLVVCKDARDIGKYKMSEVIGYHETLARKVTIA